MSRDGHAAQARSPRRARRAAGTVAWCTGLAVLARVLWLLGRGPLAAPGVSSWADVERWLHDRTAVTAAFALLRIVALAGVVYLLVLTVLALVAHLLHLPHLLRAVELSSFPAARRAISAVAGLGLGASTTLVAVTPGFGAPARPPAASADPSPVATSWRSQPVVIEQVRLAPIVLEEVPALAHHSAPTQKPPTVRLAADAPRLQPSPPPTSQPPTQTWSVQPGDHLWSIAARHLCAVWGRPVSDEETDPYWRIVVETNRAALPDPTNPDLLFAGATILLPPTPPDPDGSAPLSITPTPGSVPRPGSGPAAATAPTTVPPTGATAPAPSRASLPPPGPRATSSPGAGPSVGPRAAEDHPTRAGSPGSTIRPGPTIPESAPRAPIRPRHPTIRPDIGSSTPLVRGDAAPPTKADPTIRPQGEPPPKSARQTNDGTTERTVDRARNDDNMDDLSTLTPTHRPTVRPTPTDPADPSSDPPLLRGSTDADPDRPMVLEEIQPDTDDHG